MTRSDPLPSTGRRHPIFARVVARAGPARAQRLADVIWPIFVGGCHTSRDTLTAITTAGFHLVSTRRFRFPDSRPPSPAAPHVLGIARRPPESRPEGRQRID
jgi:hypothetical protein